MVQQLRALIALANDPGSDLHWESIARRVYLHIWRQNMLKTNKMKGQLYEVMYAFNPSRGRHIEVQASQGYQERSCLE